MKAVTIRRLAFYIITFLLVMNVFFWTGFPWRQIDRAVFENLAFDESNTKAVRSKIGVLDINIKTKVLGEEEVGIGSQRRVILNFLQTLLAQKSKPEILVLDFSFSNDTSEIRQLKKAIDLLQNEENDVKVYAAYDIDGYETAPEHLRDFYNHDINQAQLLYDSVFKHRLHTKYLVATREGKILIEHESVKYLTNYDINFNRDSLPVESLIKRVSMDISDPGIEIPYENEVVPLGDQEKMWEETFTYTPADPLGSFASKTNPTRQLDFGEKEIIIVGDLTNDNITNLEQTISFPGPHLLAWNLSEELGSEEQKIVKQFEGSLWINIIQTLVFSLLTVLLFAFLFKYIKPLQTKPLFVALFSIVGAIGFLALYVFAQGKVPLVGLSLLSIVTTAYLAWRFAHKFLTTGVAKVDPDYDVFISYSHSESDWVFKNVYEPLSEYVKPNGEKLKIFFDRKSIKLGEAFTSKYMWGIVRSKLFIPVMSEVYYKKNHCRNEIDLALQRSTEKLMDMTIIALEFDYVPPIFRKDNILVASVDPEFIEALKAQITEMETSKDPESENEA